MGKSLQNSWNGKISNAALQNKINNVSITGLNILLLS